MGGTRSGGLEHVRTERLVLSRPVDADLDEVHALHADPAVWEHLPSGRHVLARRTSVMLARWQQGWDADGLGPWVVRRGQAEGGQAECGQAEGGQASGEAGALVGVGGCEVRRGAFWNLGYRLVPGAWGQGLAQEVIAAGRGAAAGIRPDLPVVASLLQHNRGSRRAAERAGLGLAWRGPDAGNPDPTAVRLVYADRPLPEDVLAAVVHA